MLRYSLMSGESFHLSDSGELLVDGPLPLPCPISIHLSPIGCRLASYLLFIRQLQAITPPPTTLSKSCFCFEVDFA
jgi:hypothetical protein